MDNLPADDERERFEAMFRASAHRVRAYASRHVAPGDVEEVLAETYLTAWRRRDRFDGNDAVPWLLVTARNIMSNRRRVRVHHALPERDLDSVAAAVPSVEDDVVDRGVALAALARLSPAHREAVLLIAWDGLDQQSAARVAGCSTRAFTVRLHRARTRLAEHLRLAAADGAEATYRPTHIHLLSDAKESS